MEAKDSLVCLIENTECYSALLRVLCRAIHLGALVPLPRGGRMTRLDSRGGTATKCGSGEELVFGEVAGVDAGIPGNPGHEGQPFPSHIGPREYGPRCPEQLDLREDEI